MAAPLAALGGEALPADSSILADFRFANTIPPETALSELTNVYVQSLFQPSAFDFMAEIDRIGESHGLKPKPLRLLSRSLILLLRSAAKTTVSSAALKEDLGTLGFDNEHASVVAGIWEKHRGHVDAHLRSQPLASVANTLVNFDWRFGVTVATDDIERVGSTYVQLKMTVDRDGKLVDEFMELTLTQFYDLLAQLERAKSYVDYLSGTANNATTA